jgi:hypothetical protein
VPKRGDIAAQRAAEAHWADRVTVARRKYKIAESQLRRTVAGQKKWPMPEPLGSALVSAARFREFTTRKVYVQALMIYSDLLIHGELPA